MSTPDRSLQQRLDALQGANEIRTYRAQLKKDINARKVDVVDLILEPPKEIETMKIADLLLAQRQFGRSRLNRLLVSCRISPSKTIGGMSPRQRTEVVQAMSRP